MDSIIVRCKNCQHAMKFSVEKAGKRTKCPKCESVVLIQVEEKEEETKLADLPKAPEDAPSPPKPADDDEYNPTGGYDVFTDPEIERLRKERQAEEEAAAKKKKDRKKLPSVSRKVKAIPDAESWAKIRLGALFIFIGVWIWMGCHILQGWYVLVGSVEFSEYAALIARNLEVRNNDGFPEPGKGWDIDELDIHLGMIAGRDFLSLARGSLTVASLLYFLQAILWCLGYGFFLPVPRRFGMFGQVLMMFGLAVVNFVFNFAFKFLPVVGAHGYVMIPFLVPEIVMTEYNMERMVPINILWSGAPFWENALTVIMKFLLYLEPTFVCIFIWSAGVAVKDDQLAEGGKGRAMMSLGTVFIAVAFNLLSLCGASPVLVIVLRVFYFVWYVFTLMFMLQYAMLLLRLRSVLYDKINPKHELEDEAPKKKKKK